METLMDYFGKYAAAEANKFAGSQFEYLAILGFAVLVTFFGCSLMPEFKALRKYAILAPVVSDLIFSLVISGIKGVSTVEFIFDTKIMKGFYQNLFSLCVGYGFNAKTLKNASDKLCIMITFAARPLIASQNTLGAVFAHAIGTSPLLVLQCFSASISGGVGMAFAFSPIFEKMGAADATTVDVAAGTSDNVVGSLTGGPVAAYLITSKGLKSDPSNKPEAQRAGERPIPDNTRMIYTLTTCLLFAAFGMLIYTLLDSIPMIEMPKFIGCLFAGAIDRNVMEAPGVDTRVPGTEAIEHAFLELYLTLVLTATSITKPAPVAGQVGIIFIAQVIMMAILAVFISFNLFGKDYGAVVMAAGNYGWGCGSGPNAVANEKAVMGQYGYHDVTWVLYPSFAVIVSDIYNPICLSLMGSFFGK